MAKNFRLNNEGFRRLRRDPRVLADLMDRAERVAEAAGPGFEAKESPGINRARVTVFPTTPAAYRANSTEAALLRALPHAIK